MDSENTNQNQTSSNKSLIAVIGGAILAVVVVVMGLIAFFVNPQTGKTCSGKDSITGTEQNGYKDQNGVCKTLDGKELK